MHNIKLALIKCIMNMFQEKGQWQIIKNGMAWKWLAIYSSICCEKRGAGIHWKRCVLLKKLKLLARLPVFCQRLLSYLDPSWTSFLVLSFPATWQGDTSDHRRDKFMIRRKKSIEEEPNLSCTTWATIRLVTEVCYIMKPMVLDIGVTFWEEHAKRKAITKQVQ